MEPKAGGLRFVERVRATNEVHADRLHPEARRFVPAAVAAAVALHALGPKHVLVKGGHGSGLEVVDVLYDGKHFVEFSAARIPTPNTHGTGCTLSSAIAALLPQRSTVADAVRDAREYLLGAIRASGELDVGSGHGPLHHFHQLWRARRTAKGEPA